MSYGADLYWLPLGSGGHSVRLNGRAYEAVVAGFHRRRRCELYHSALVVYLPGGRFVIEQTPIPDGRARERGVVGVAVATRSHAWNHERAEPDMGVEIDRATRG